MICKNIMDTYLKILTIVLKIIFLRNKTHLKKDNYLHKSKAQEISPQTKLVKLKVTAHTILQNII